MSKWRQKFEICPRAWRWSKKRHDWSSAWSSPTRFTCKSSLLQNCQAAGESGLNKSGDFSQPGAKTAGIVHIMPGHQSQAFQLLGAELAHHLGRTAQNHGARREFLALGH